MINSVTKSGAGLARKLKDRIIEKALERKMQELGASDGSLQGTPLCNGSPVEGPPVDVAFTSFSQHPGYLRYRLIKEGAARLGIENPFFQELEAVSGPTTVLQGREVLNFSGYNYLGLAGDPRVHAAAVEAIGRLGTSVSASRIVSGERGLHRELERELASVYQADDSVVMVSGHATTVTTLGYLFGPRDLIIHDVLIHNCALEGAKLSSARRMSFPHNDWEALDAILARCRHQFERVCILIEGLYSMDGDFPDLPRFIGVKRRRRAFLMVDEAHSLGVMGPRGFGLADHYRLDPREVDIWMGTLSKTLASCGGYIAGEQALIDNLKHAAPGFVYSVGMAPPVAAAALAALCILKDESWRVERLQQIGAVFLEHAREAGIDTGTSRGLAILPAVTGSSARAARLAIAMRREDINVQPVLYPAVSEQSARLRFFLSSMHSEEDVVRAVQTLAALWADG